ncbi:uncharacterized protein LOC125945064 [Dermacentor silvarum]|uniref:uncharacterized protein LOC125945064 n=1 Tax=Dermacentor silvarum TaxID=543639 RepID=UPI002101A2ED|nr:uncharacterized protein LOC125945064 [Dermacentor silvarum]
MTSGTPDSSDPEHSIPPRIMWLHQNLPWSQFIFAETVVVAAITVLVVVGTLVAQAVLGFYTPPCTTPACDQAMNLARSSQRMEAPPCDGFYEHMCGGASSDYSRRHPLVHAMSAALLDRGAAVGSDAKNKDALDKAAVFYASCHKHFLPSAEQSGLHQDVINVLTIIKTRWEDIAQHSVSSTSTLKFMLRLVLTYRIELGIRMRLYAGNMHLMSGNSLRSHLALPARQLEGMLSTAANASGATLTSAQITQLLIVDESLTNHLGGEEDVSTWPPDQLFLQIYPKDREAWVEALGDDPRLLQTLDPTKLVHVKGMSFLHMFTHLVLETSSRITRSVWLLVHALLPALEAEVVRHTPPEQLADAVVLFCYRHSLESQYGVAMESFLWTLAIGSQSVPSALPTTQDLVRSQAALSAARLFRGGLLHEVMEELEDIQERLFLDPTSSEEARLLEKLYRDLPTPSRSGYYVNRLLPIAMAPDSSPLLEGHSRCLEDDLLGAAEDAYTRRHLCVSPAILSQPLFYPGTEGFVNFPTLGFLLAEPYADVLFRALRKAPSGTDTSRRFAATMACLRRQLESLSNTSITSEARPAALFRHAGALQLAHDAVENSGGFSGGDGQRRAFFERHCWLWCSQLLRGARSSSTSQLDAKGVCNIAVRNVLAFYRAFRCYPEDYMGSVEVCAVFGVPPYKE